MHILISILIPQLLYRNVILKQTITVMTACHYTAANINLFHTIFLHSSLVLPLFLPLFPSLSLYTGMSTQRCLCRSPVEYEEYCMVQVMHSAPQNYCWDSHTNWHEMNVQLNKWTSHCCILIKMVKICPLFQLISTSTLGDQSPYPTTCHILNCFNLFSSHIPQSTQSAHSSTRS